MGKISEVPKGSKRKRVKVPYERVAVSGFDAEQGALPQNAVTIGLFVREGLVLSTAKSEDLP